MPPCAAWASRRTIPICAAWQPGQIIFGGVLLLAGRRLYWLLAAGAGFVLGYLLAQNILREQPDNVILVVALVVAVIFAVLAVVGQRFVIGLVGFIAGGIGLLRLLEVFNITAIEPSTVLGIVVFIVRHSGRDLIVDPVRFGPRHPVHAGRRADSAWRARTGFRATQWDHNHRPDRADRSRIIGSTWRVAQTLMLESKSTRRGSNRLLHGVYPP